MIKQPYQILKWYNGDQEQEYYDLMKHDIFEIQRYDTHLPPPFIIKRDNRIDTLDSWDMICLDGTTYDMTNAAINPGYADNFDIRSDNVDFDYLVWEKFPTIQDIPEGRYYYVVSDGIETWYSEVFELCDYWEHIMNNSTNGAGAAGWDTHTDTNHDNYIDIVLQETTANSAYNYSNTFDVVYNEKIQLYIFEDLTAKSASITVYLQDTTDAAQISEEHTISEGVNVITITPQRTTTARFRFQLANAQTYDATIYVWSFWWYVSDMTVLRWTDDQNFCDLPFADGFDGYLILKGYPHQMSTTVEGDADEDEEKNTYPLIQTIQKWYTFTIGSGVHFMEGLTMLGLFDEVTFTTDDGIEVYAIDPSLKSVHIDDFLYVLTLTYREDSCSKEACGFLTECCCPTLENVLDYENGGVAALGACGGTEDGNRYLVLEGGKVYIYECVAGTGWTRQEDEECRNACVYDEDADTSEDNNHYWVWNPVTEQFQYVCELNNVAPVGGGLVRFNAGDVIHTDEFDCVLYVQPQRDGGGGWENLGDPFTLDYFHDTVNVDVSSPLGLADFRLMVYNHNCEPLHYTSEFNNINVT